MSEITLSLSAKSAIYSTQYSIFTLEGDAARSLVVGIAPEPAGLTGSVDETKKLVVLIVNPLEYRALWVRLSGSQEVPLVVSHHEGRVTGFGYPLKKREREKSLPRNRSHEDHDKSQSC